MASESTKLDMQQADRQRVPEGHALVNKGALKMVVNALRRDAEEGRVVRGEMADELLAAAPEAPAQEPHCLDGECSDCTPRQDFSDAYQGAREDLAIWKKRALEAEELNRKFMREINGQTFMGEPASKTPAQASAVDERAEFEAWAADYALRHEPNYSKATEDDCWAAWQARAALAQKGGAA